MRSLEEIGQQDQQESKVVNSESEEADEEFLGHRRRRGKKFGHAIVGAVKKGKAIYDKGKAIAESDLGKAAIKAAKAHASKALALLEDVDVAEDDDQDLELSDEDFEVEGPFHRRRRGKKFGHGLVKAAKVAKKVYDHPVGKAAITAAMAAR